MVISVVMATFNGEKVILPQLESIKNQTLQPTEVLIFDDGSSDSTRDIVQEFIQVNLLEHSWRLYGNKKNLGYCNNFRQAISQSTGDILFFADQDDIWKPEKIEVMTQLMMNESEMEMLAAEFIPFRKEHAIERKETDDTQTYQTQQLDLSQKNMYLRSVGCTMAVKRSLVEAVLPFWYDNWAHDEIFWKLSLCRKSGYSVNYLSIYRRFHANNTSGQKMHTVKKRLEYLKNLEKSFLYMYRFGEKQGLSKEELALIKKNETMAEYRQHVLMNRNIYSACRLLTEGLHTYHKKRGWLVELYLGMTNKGKGISD